MPSTLLAAIASSFVIWLITIATSHFTTSAIPGITCFYRSSHGIQFFIPFFLMAVFQLGLVSLTLVHAIKIWRAAKGPLHAVLAKHNTFYYACGLLLSAMNALAPVLFSDVCILAILAMRMHLHLWHIDRHMHDTGALGLVWISMSDMSLGDRSV